MQFAINPITNVNYDFESSVNAYHQAGISAMEIWFDRLDAFLDGREIGVAADFLAEKNMTLASSICAGQIMLRDITAAGDDFVEFKRRLAITRDLNCPTLLFIPDNPDEPDRNVYGICEKNLKKAAEVAADHGVKLALEFLQGNKLCGTLNTAKRLVRNVDHPNLGLLIDLSHQWMDRSDLDDIADLTADELLIVHVDDMVKGPPEALIDHDRTFPGEGRGIDHSIIPAIQATGYDGYWSLEIFNHDIWKQPLDDIVAASLRSFKYMQQRYG